MLLGDGTGNELSNDRRRSAAAVASDSTSDYYQPRIQSRIQSRIRNAGSGITAGKIREVTQPTAKLLLLYFGACNLYIMEGIELKIFSKSYCTTNISYPFTQNSISKSLSIEPLKSKNRQHYQDTMGLIRLAALGVGATFLVNKVTKSVTSIPLIEDSDRSS